MELKPKAGAIALCSKGFLGLITVDEPQKVRYESDESEAMTWIGIHLETRKNLLDNHPNAESKSRLSCKIGDPWSSRNPVVLGYTDDLIEAFHILDENRRFEMKTGIPGKDVKEMLDLTSGWEREDTPDKIIFKKGEETFEIKKEIIAYVNKERNKRS